MELSLSLQDGIQVLVACDRRESHLFELSTLIPDEKIAGRPPQPLLNPLNYGQTLFSALFPIGSPAQQALRNADRLALVLDNELETIFWEYLHGPDGFLALEIPIVRLLQPGNRQSAPDLSSTPLQVLAVPSNPISRDVPPLNIVGEWRRLREGVEKLPHQVRLERVTPPTIDNLRGLTLTRPQSVIHFMGHGGQEDGQAMLLFENEAGGVQPISARDLALSVKKHSFLVTLNACVSATPGKTEFSNLARLLVERGLPYALGMSASIPDDAALTFSRALYAELANGVEVEEAVFQARRSLMRGEKRTWLVGVPVLYSSLETPCAGGFATPAGLPQVNENRPRMEVSALPRTEGAFQGRVEELLQLGQALTGELRTKLLTIHGMGGQGKTALARETAERFAHAWPGGVWAVSLENLYTLDRFALELARLLKIDIDSIYKQVASLFPDLDREEYQNHFQKELERRILVFLDNHRTLLILDNAETFIDAVDAKNIESIDMAVFLREKVLSAESSLLVTSRNHLGWPGEQLIELGGLSSDEGARLFWQSVPGREKDAIGPLAQEISQKVGGHPLSLRLLGGAFDASSASLEVFVHEVEVSLLQAEDKYKHVDHRHRTLYASIETSVQHLDKVHQALLSSLWIFKAPFLPENIQKIFQLNSLLETPGESQQITEQLRLLFQRGLLSNVVTTSADDKLLFYRMLPIVGLFVKHHLDQAIPVKSLQFHMAKTYSALLKKIYEEIDRSNWASSIAIRSRIDFESCAGWVEPSEVGWYLNRQGWVVQRIGDWQAGLNLLEQALELAQGIDQALEADALNNMAGIYRETGQPNKALNLFEKSLLIMSNLGNDVGKAAILNNLASVYRDKGELIKSLQLYKQSLNIQRTLGDQEGEATTLNNLASVYSLQGQPGRAIRLCKKILPIRRAVGDRGGEAATLNNLARIYLDTGRPSKALELHEQALSIQLEIKDKAGEAITLNNMVLAYSSTGQLNHALELSEQALSMMRNVGDRVGEASALNNMGLAYNAISQPGHALELYEQALLITRETSDLTGEASTLNNMGLAYKIMGQPEKALDLYQKALPLRQIVGDKAGEAAALSNMAIIYSNMGESNRALELNNQALAIAHKIGDMAGEANTLTNISVLLYSDLGHPQEAKDLLRQAIAILRKLGLKQDSAGTTIHEMQSALELMESGQSLTSGLSPEQIKTVVENTIIVLTKMPDRFSDWRETVTELLEKMRSKNTRAEIDFFSAILALLNGVHTNLPTENPYIGALQDIIAKTPPS